MTSTPKDLNGRGKMLHSGRSDAMYYLQLLKCSFLKKAGATVPRKLPSQAAPIEVIAARDTTKCSETL
jgi:hypothetical protein